MKNIFKTTSLFFLVIAFITISFSFFIKMYPDYQALAKVKDWKRQVNSYKNEQLEKEKSEWKEYKVDKDLKGPEIEEDDWSYPMFTIKHSGGFENITSDTVFPQDTIHIIYNAKCFSFLKKEGRIFKDTLSKITLCKYKVKKDKLVLKLYEENISNGEEVIINLKDRKFKIDYKTAYVFPYKTIYWEVKERSLILNQFLPVKIGSVLKGELNLEVEESILLGGDKAPTKRTKIIKGKFQIEIEKISPNYF